MSWQLFPVLPTPVIVLVALVLTALLIYGSRLLLLDKHVPKKAVLRLGLLRLGMIAIITLSLFQPVFSLPRTVIDSPGLLVLVDSSASMATKTDDSTRWETATKQVLQSPAVQSAGNRQALHWFTFDRRAMPVTSSEIAGITPTGDETDLAASLNSAWSHLRLLNASREVAAMPTRALIVSDGLNRSSTDVAAAARKLGLALDVLPLNVKEEISSSSAATIELVQTSRRVLVGSETAFQVTVRPRRSIDTLTLVVDEDGQELQREEISGLTAAEDRFVIVKAQPKEAGLKRYEFRLMQGDATIGDPFAVNVQAVDDRHDVLLLDDTWRWEFKYLRRVLEDDPSFNLTAFLSRGGNAFVQFGEPDRRVKLGGFPQSRSELDGFDTIVLGDVQPTNWPRGLARNIHASISEGGKSLIVIAGRHLGEWVESPELSRLLPVEVTRDSGLPLSGPIEIRLTPEGRSSGWFTLPTGQNPEATAVTSLPSLEHVYPAHKKRPAATVLAETISQRNANGPLPVIAEHTYGRGRVLFIATDTLWRWQTYGPRTDDGVTLHAAFWQHALRAMAPAEPTATGRRLFLRPGQTQARVGDRVRIAADLETPVEESTPALEAMIVLPDGRRIPAAFHISENAAQPAAVEFEPTLPGRYRIEAVARIEGAPVAETFTVIEVAGRGQEADGSPVDRAALERWAVATGGRVIDPDQADGWLAADAHPSVTTVRRQSYDLWHNFSLLLLLCVLLAADWSYRLFRGYV